MVQPVRTPIVEIGDDKIVITPSKFLDVKFGHIEIESTVDGRKFLVTIKPKEE